MPSLSWQETLKVKGLPLNRIKTEYMKFKFSNSRHMKTIVKRRDDELPKSFKYLGWFLQKDWGVDRDVLRRIQGRWLK